MGLESLARKLFTGIVLAASSIASYQALPQHAAYAQDAKTQDATRVEEELPVLKKRRITFEQVVEQLKKDPKGDKAGKYDQLKMQYLDQLLVDEYKLVRDTKRNQDGFVSEWLYWQDKNHQKRATERITKERGVVFVKPIVDALPSWKIIPCFQGRFGQKKKLGYLLIDEALFQLAKDDDVSMVLDYVSPKAWTYKNIIRFFKKDLVKKNAALSHYRDNIIHLHARLNQMAQITKKKRSVSDEFKQSVMEKYVECYARCQNGLRDATKTYTETGVGQYDEAAKAVESFLKEVNDRMCQLGYEHKRNEKENTYELVKISEKK